MVERTKGMVHVLIIPSWYPTSDNPINGIFFREQAQALAQCGLKVGVIYPQLHALRHIHKLSPMSFGLMIEDDHGLSTYRYNSINFFPRFARGRVWSYQWAGMRAFKRYVNDNGMPDVLHAHSALNGGILGSHIRSLYHIPLVITEHSTVYAREILTVRERKSVNDVFSSSDKLISVSPQLGEVLSRQFPGISKKWEWVPNIVDSSFLCGRIRHEDRRPNKFVFLNVALMAEKKGQKDLLEAFARGFKGETDVELWLGGDGPMRSILEAYAIKLGIASQVHFLGLLNRTRVGEAMRAADVFVLSSHYETFGVVLVEALATGIPVIATRCGGPECIVRKEDGMLVPIGDIEVLADAMKTIRRNIHEYDAESLRAACRVRFGADAVVAQLRQIYADLLAAPNLTASTPNSRDANK